MNHTNSSQNEAIPDVDFKRRTDLDEKERQIITAFKQL